MANHHPCSDATFKPASLTVIINEPGLYSLIDGSELPTAKAIKYWMYHTVLPRLRQLSMYQLVPPPTEAPALPSPTLTIEPVTAD